MIARILTLTLLGLAAGLSVHAWEWTEYRAAVLIRIERASGSALCSAVAIAPRLLLTAAHCADEAAAISVFDEASGHEIRADRWVLNEGYRPADSLYEHDLALLHLETGLARDLPFARPAAEETLKAMGGTRWERVGFGERDQANSRTRTDPRFLGEKTAGVWALEDHYAVPGDSGGPVYARVNGELFLAGTHSTRDGASTAYAVSAPAHWAWVQAQLLGPAR